MTTAATRLELLLLVPVVGYALLCLLAFLFQRSLLYLPSRWSEEEARQANPGYVGVRFQTSDGETLHGWLRRREAVPWTVVVFHGNAGYLAVQEGLMAPFVALDLQVLLFDYRGYGLSSGRPTEEGLILDGEAAVRFVEEELGAARDRLLREVARHGSRRAHGGAAPPRPAYSRVGLRLHGDGGKLPLSLSPRAARPP